MKAKVLITGGTGLIGSHLSIMLRQKDYQVSYLSRSKGEGEIKKYRWNPAERTMEVDAIREADFIINLAGANLFDKKWTKEFKRQIVESRTQSTGLLYEKLRSTPHHVRAFISASAIGFYGADTGQDLVDETSGPGDDFLSEVVQKWEAAAEQVASLNIRTVKLRIGIVLTPKGGALEKLMAPIQKGAGAVIGSGKQYISWIHINDLCNLFIRSIEDESMKGVYNAVSPHPVNNEELTKLAAEKINRYILLPNVPEFALKWLLGSEKAAVVIGGNKVSAEKILKTGFKFQFPDMEGALDNLLKHSS